jgi:hypothetical protein
MESLAAKGLGPEVRQCLPDFYLIRPTPMI